MADHQLARVLAQLALHEALLVSLWANALRTSPNPELAAAATMEKSMESLEKVWADKMQGREAEPDVIPHLRPAALNFWLKVERNLGSGEL